MISGGSCSYRPGEHVGFCKGQLNLLIFNSGVEAGGFVM